MEENTTLSEEVLLSKLNDSVVLTIIPVIVYVAVLMTLGLLGNIFVCYFYIVKTGKSSNIVFIVALAIYDLLVCCVAIPFEIVELRFFYTFTNDAGCKIGRFVNTFGSIGSAFILTIIAVDRFRKICRPHGKQLDIRGAKLAIGISSTVAALVSCPTFLMYDTVPVEIFNEDGVKLHGFDCTTVRNGTYASLVFAFNVTHAVGFVSIIVILITMYSLIGRKLYTIKKNTQGQSDHDQTTLRYTMMMMIITVVFVLSFLPYLTLASWRAVTNAYEGKTMSNTELVAFNIGLRSFFLNSAINPLIYGLFNPKFKGFILDIICPCRRREQ